MWRHRVYERCYSPSRRRMYAAGGYLWNDLTGTALSC